MKSDSYKLTSRSDEKLNDWLRKWVALGAMNLEPEMAGDTFEGKILDTLRLNTNTGPAKAFIVELECGLRIHHFVGVGQLRKGQRVRLRFRGWLADKSEDWHWDRVPKK